MNFNELSTTFPSVFGFGSYMTLMVAIFTEFCCSLFLMTGLLLRIMVIPMIISMAVAFFDIHDAMLPEGELSLIYMIVFLILYFTGPGRYSLDYLIDTRIKKDLDEINRLAESDKYEDLNKAVKKLIDNGFYGTRNFDMRGRLQQGIKEKRPETYKDILDTKAHHKDVQAFKDAEQKVTEKIRKKHLDAQKVLGKLYNEKKHGRYNKLAKMYEENSETLKFLIAGEKDQLNSLKEWAKGKIYRK